MERIIRAAFRHREGLCRGVMERKAGCPLLGTLVNN